jgi:hypothetical protein
MPSRNAHPHSVADRSPGRRLSKRDVELLLRTYDTDPIAALSVALQRLLGRSEAGFDQLLDQLVRDGLLTVERQVALLRRDEVALDALATELNEMRDLRP